MRDELRVVEPSDVRDYYNAWTEKYIQDFGDCIQAHRPSREEDLLEYLMTRAGLRDGQRVLDAGCGVCGPARYFASHRNLDIEAITVSPVQADMPRARSSGGPAFSLCGWPGRSSRWTTARGSGSRAGTSSISLPARRHSTGRSGGKCGTHVGESWSTSVARRASPVPHASTSQLQGVA